MKKITENTKIIEVLKMDPNTAEIFFEFGMHCIGCPHASGDSLGQATRAHGVDTALLIEKLNEYFSH